MPSIKPKKVLKYLLIFVSFLFIFPSLVVIGYYIRVGYEKKYLFNPTETMATTDKDNGIDDNIGVEID